MSTTRVESKLVNWYAGAPHLPRMARRWLAANLWWIVLIIAIIWSLVVLKELPSAFVDNGRATYSDIYTYSPISYGVQRMNTIITVTLGAISVVLLYSAIRPLKEMRRRGWRRLLVNEIVVALSAVASFLILFQALDIFGLVWGLVFVAVELYFLFEVHDEFHTRVGKARNAKVAGRKPATRKRSSSKKLAR